MPLHSSHMGFWGPAMGIQGIKTLIFQIKPANPE